MANYRPTELTKSGLRALQSVIQGNIKLEFSKIKIGVGQVVGDISDLTDLVDSKIEANITAVKNNEDGSCTVCGSYTNEGMTESYTLNEIGIFVKDSDGNDVLYAYSTADGEGDWFGAGNTLLQENIEVVVYVSTASDITANIVRATKARDIDVNGVGLDSVIVSMGEVSEGLGERLGVVENKVSQISNPNLLINSNFKASELVNQRGQSTYSSNGYSIDMWQLMNVGVGNSNLSVEEEYVKLTCVNTGENAYTEFRQLIENIDTYAGKKLTLTIDYEASEGSDCIVWIPHLWKPFKGDGTRKKETFTFTFYPTNLKGVNIRLVRNSSNSIGDYIKIYSVKLELGEIATPFVDDDRATKLYKCQRYLQVFRLENSARDNSATLIFSNTIHFSVNLFTSMRVIPNIASTKIPGIFTAKSVFISGFNINFGNISKHSFEIIAIKNNHSLTALDTPVAVMVNPDYPSGVEIIVSAEL